MVDWNPFSDGEDDSGIDKPDALSGDSPILDADPNDLEYRINQMETKRENYRKEALDAIDRLQEVIEEAQGTADPMLKRDLKLEAQIAKDDAEQYMALRSIVSAKYRVYRQAKSVMTGVSEIQDLDEDLEGLVDSQEYEEVQAEMQDALDYIRAQLSSLQQSGSAFEGFQDDVMPIEDDVEETIEEAIEGERDLESGWDLLEVEEEESHASRERLSRDLE